MALFSPSLFYMFFLKSFPFLCTLYITFLTSWLTLLLWVFFFPFLFFTSTKREEKETRVDTDTFAYLVDLRYLCLFFFFPYSINSGQPGDSNIKKKKEGLQWLMFGICKCIHMLNQGNSC